MEATIFVARNWKMLRSPWEGVRGTWGNVERK